MSDHRYPEWPSDRDRAEAKEGEIERLDAVVSKLKARLADRERRIRLACTACARTGFAPFDVLAPLDLKLPLPKKGAR